MRKYLTLLLLVLVFTFQSVAQVSKTISVTSAGSLTSLLTATEKTTVTDLTITGNLDARDFKCLRDELSVLSVLDLTNVSIVAYSGNDGTFPTSWGFAEYPDNTLPQYAFNKDVTIGKLTLSKVILPSSINAIGNFAFQYCSNLTDVNLPVSLTTIGNNAFYACTNLNNFIIPDNVTSIGASAYQYCHAITSITFGSKLNEIGNQAFYECHSLKIIDSKNTVPPVLLGDPFGFTYLSMVYVPAQSINTYRSTNGWKLLNIGSSTLITINNASAGSLKSAFTSQTQVPLSSITKLKITGQLNNSDIYLIRDSLKILMEIDLSESTFSANTLPSGAFQGKGIIVDVKLPESVMVIGDNAFNSCVNLNSHVPLPSGLTTIGTGAFYNCKLMTGDLILPSNVQTIGNNAFDGCRSLAGSIVLPSNVVSIGNSAFKDCVGLTGSLVLPESVVTLGSYAFQNCTGLNGNLTLSGNLSKIPNGAFATCTGLTGSLTIPASVTSIEGSAFTECSKITELTLPKNLTSIGDEAFYSCSGLTKIISLNSLPPTIYNNTFRFVNKSACQLKVPIGSKSAYQAADYWKQFSLISEDAGTFNIIVNSGTNGKVKVNSTIIESGTAFLADKNSSVKFTIVPDDYYVVDTLRYNSVDVTSQIVNNQYITPIVVGNSVLDVKFHTAQKITIKIDPQSGGGTIMYNGSILKNDTVLAVYKGLTKTFEIVPAENYALDSLLFGGTICSLPLTNNLYTTDSIKTDAVLKAIFKKITYKITLQTNAGGMVKENGAELTNGTMLVVEQNAHKTFTIIPQEGYVVDSIIYAGNDVKSQLTINQYTTPAINSNTNLKVVFKESTEVFTVRILKGLNGTIKENNLLLNNNDLVSAKINAVKLFTIIPDEGYQLDSVRFNGVDVKSQIVNNVFSAGPLNSNDTLKVTFKKILQVYNITIQIGSGGGVKENNIALSNNTIIQAQEGTSRTFSILPGSGYEVATLTYNANDVKSQISNGMFTTPSVTGNAILNVTFAKINYSITINSGTGGVVKDGLTVLSNNASVNVEAYSTKTFTIQPDAGYEVATLTLGGLDMKNQLVNNQFTTPNIIANTTLNVTFKLQSTSNTYKLKVVFGVGGIIKENNNVLKSDTLLTTNNGSTRTFTIIPDVGYRIAAVIYGGTFVTTQVINGMYVTPLITSDKTLAVTFEKLKYNLSIKSAINGVVNLVCYHGDTPTFSIAPEAGWKINSIIYNGSDITTEASNSEYTVPPVTKNTTLTISYESLTASPVIGISDVKVYTNNSNIIIDGLSDDEMVNVFTMNGSRICSLKSQGELVQIPVRQNAIYLVKTGGKTYKVIL